MTRLDFQEKNMEILMLETQPEFRMKIDFQIGLDTMQSTD